MKPQETLMSGRRDEATGDSKRSQCEFSEGTVSKGTSQQQRLQDPTVSRSLQAWGLVCFKSIY